MEVKVSLRRPRATKAKIPANARNTVDGSGVVTVWATVIAESSVLLLNAPVFESVITMLYNSVEGLANVPR